MYEVGIIPEFTQADRLAKARSLTGLSTTEFAKVIGVSQKTVNNAESGKHGVRKIVLNAWAMATGVPAVWLETGQVPTGNDGGDDERPRQESNLRPRDYNVVSFLARTA